jgi:NAD(P)-dependent dehydrogenase (short-subunit alcohol dehydrogenase family)
VNYRRLRDRVALVTGASRGIGRATALALARQGSRVVVTSRNLDGSLDALAEEIRSEGGKAFAIPADVSRPEDVRRLVRETIDRCAMIDIAVCNAGVYIRRSVKDLQVGEIERAMGINFYGTVHVIEAVLPLMLVRGTGHIVAVTSVDGRKGLPPDGAYVASKFATTGYMDVLRQELHGTGVYATTILPGRVDTNMIADLDVPFVSPKISSERVARAVVRAIGQRRREIIIPFWGPKALVVLNAVSPAVGDWLVRLFRLEGTEHPIGPMK